MQFRKRFLFSWSILGCNTQDQCQAAKKERMRRDLPSGVWLDEEDMRTKKLTFGSSVLAGN